MEDGCGYATEPIVRLIGGGGTGAKLTAHISDGVVSYITIDNPGSGYSEAPSVRIAAPSAPAHLTTRVSRITVTIAQLLLDERYQVFSSKDLQTWSPLGPSFVAEDDRLTAEFETNETGLYFKVLQVP